MLAGAPDKYAGTSDRASVLAEAAREAREAPDLTALARVVVGAARRGLGAVQVLIAAATENMVDLVAVHGSSADDVRAFPVDRTAPLPVCAAIRYGREWWSGTPHPEGIVPVAHEGQVVGAITVIRSERAAFDADDQAFFRGLADAAAPAWKRLASGRTASSAIDPPVRSDSEPRIRRLGRDVLVGVGAPALAAAPFVAWPSSANQFGGRAVQIAAVVLVALWLGRRAGIIAAVVSTVCVWYLLNEPHYSFDLPSWGDALGVVAYAATAAVSLVLVAKFTEARRRESVQRRRLDMLVHDAPIGVAVFGRDLRFRTVNPTMAVMDHRSMGAHLQRRWADVSPQHAALIEPYLAAVRDSGTAIIDAPLSLILADEGVERHWIASFFPLANDRGEPDEVAATFVDVTAEVIGRQRRLELLRLTETIGGLTRLDDLAAAVADFCVEMFGCRTAVGFVTDPEVLEIFASSGFEPHIEREWFHRKIALDIDTPLTEATRSGEMIEIPNVHVLVERYPDLAVRRMATAEEACVSVPLRIGAAHARTAGALHLSWMRPRTLTNVSKETVRTVAALTATVARRLRAAEESADDRFKSALEAMTGTVAITRAVRDHSGSIIDFVIEYMNDPETTPDRDAAEAFVGQSLTELYPDWLDNGRFEQLVEVVETGIPLNAEDVPYTAARADGSTRQGFSTYQVVRFDEGYLLSWHDVTDSVLAEQRARQLSVERSRREAVDSLARLTTRLAASTTNADVADAVCEHAALAAGADFVGIALISTPTTFTLQFSEGLDAHLAPSGAAFDIADDSPFAVALGRGTPIEIEWLPDFATHRAALVDAMVEAGLRSVAFVPMRGERGVLLGALAFAWVDRHELGPGTEDARAATVVDVVTTSLQRGAAEEAGRRRRAQADAMSTLAAALAGAVGPEDVWRIASRHVPTVFGASRISIARLADDESELLMTFVDDEHLTDPWPVRPFPITRRAPLTDAVRERRIVVYDGPDAVERAYPDLATPAGREWGGIAAVPVLGTERVLGVLGIALRPGLTFDAHERNLLAFVGSLLGQAATRAQLFDRERARRRMIEAIQRASVDILAVHDAEPAHAIAQSAARILDATRYVLYAVDVGVLRLLDASGYGIELRAELPLAQVLPPTDAARLGEPVLVDNVDEWPLRYPDVDRFAGDPTLAVPLHDQTGAVACVIGFGFGNRVRFPTGLRESVPEITAHWSAVYQRARAAHAERDAALREHRVAVSLQHAMLGRPDDVRRAEWGAAYKPADRTLEVGGDWYDLIDLAHNRVGLVVGDIVGHHLGAAAAMGQVRAAVRALAPSVKDPAELLEHIDAFVEPIEEAHGATLAYAVLDPRSGHVAFSCAGHLPPLVVSDGAYEFLLDGRNVPLGGFMVRPRDTAHFTLRPDQTLVLYSDGLVERRGESVDVGMDRLGRAAAALAPSLDALALCNRLVVDLLEGVDQRDDIAVLAVRPIPHELHISRPADPEMLRPARQLLRTWLEAADATSGEIDELVLSAGEALTNAIEHATPEVGDAQVFLDAVVHDDVVTITVRDRGRWRPRDADNPERGRGLHIMKYFNDVNIASDDSGTTVELSRRLGGPRPRQ